MATSIGGPVELKGMTLPELEALASGLGGPAYRGRQIARWVYQGNASSFAEMSDLPASLRGRLAEAAVLTSLEPLTEVTADGGDTVKYLVSLADGATVETVFMRYEDGRRSVCISTQVGCGMGCTFCATGLAGLTRNLTAAEIIDQVLLVQRKQRERITNVVFMGMGEPLANYQATLRALQVLNAPYGLGIGMRHLTVSTVGLVPQIQMLAKERLQFTLAVSLHAPDDDLRSALVPINRRWPISELLTASGVYVRQTGRRVSFEYVLLEGVNDRPDQGALLGRLLAEHARAIGETPAAAWHVNLIPWNPVYGMQYHRPGRGRVEGFLTELDRRGVPATVRLERGIEIDAACGQLQRTHGLTEGGDAATRSAGDAPPRRAGTSAGTRPVQEEAASRNPT
ncbi:MAG TPA: 23S rRNA (adenine(2503)-C(2))-methyltransferase RlmN [bacterium]|nr:23S rRNA (adenine(2503)-C(2))-methyltransferase RlmN [bacterium]